MLFWLKVMHHNKPFGTKVISLISHKMSMCLNTLCSRSFFVRCNRGINL